MTTRDINIATSKSNPSLALPTSLVFKPSGPGRMMAIRRIDESTYVFQALRDHTLDDLGDLSRPYDNIDRHDPLYALGVLEQLPVEILHMMCAQLDINSLVRLRQASRRAMEIVNSTPQYKQIIANAPGIIRGILSIGRGNWISCQDVFEKLCTPQCDLCGDFGPYLYLITCRRVCFLCFTEETSYLPLLRADASRKFGLRAEYMASIPSMRSVPGYYSSWNIKCRAATTLIDHDSARRAGILVHSTVDAMEQYATQMIAQRTEKYQCRKSRHASGASGAKHRQPKSTGSFEGQTCNTKRFMGIINAPFFDRRKGRSEWGFHCIACKSHYYRKPYHWRRKFTQDSFEHHIKECGEIKHGIHIKPAK